MGEWNLNQEHDSLKPLAKFGELAKNSNFYTVLLYLNIKEAKNNKIQEFLHYRSINLPFPNKDNS